MRLFSARCRTLSSSLPNSDFALEYIFETEFRLIVFPANSEFGKGGKALP